MTQGWTGILLRRSGILSPNFCRLDSKAYAVPLHTEINSYLRLQSQKQFLPDDSGVYPQWEPLVYKEPPYHSVNALFDHLDLLRVDSSWQRHFSWYCKYVCWKEFCGCVLLPLMKPLQLLVWFYCNLYICTHQLRTQPLVSILALHFPQKKNSRQCLHTLDSTSSL